MSKKKKDPLDALPPAIKNRIINTALNKIPFQGELLQKYFTVDDLATPIATALVKLNMSDLQRVSTVESKVSDIYLTYNKVEDFYIKTVFKKDILGFSTKLILSFIKDNNVYSLEITEKDLTKQDFELELYIDKEIIKLAKRANIQIKPKN